MPPWMKFLSLKMKRNAAIRHRRAPRLGQHFLVSRPVQAAILAAAGRDPRGTVLEIGPGNGVLTLPLAGRFAHIIAVEKDERLAAELAATLQTRGITNVQLIPGDILALFPEKLPLPENYRVIANIPYYLTGRLIRRLLESAERPQDILLTVQKEVAERIVAKPPRMNLLALSVQAYGKPQIIARVPAQAFRPQPKVDSAIIKISEISDAFFTKNRIASKHFFGVLHAAFSGKRKILENSLSKNLKLPKTELIALLSRLKLEGRRAETLSLVQWGKLAHALRTKVS